MELELAVKAALLDLDVDAGVSQCRDWIASVRTYPQGSSVIDTHRYCNGTFKIQIHQSCCASSSEIGCGDHQFSLEACLSSTCLNPPVGAGYRVRN